MKLLPIKLLALAYTATTAIAINDDNKTNNNNNSLLLRGSSSSTPLLIANKWDDGCTPDGSLQPYARNGLTMEQICARNYGHTMYPPKHFLVPYKCESGAGYACCVDDLGDTTDQSSVGLGMCTKASSEDDNDNTRSSSNGECKPDGSLNPRSRMNWGVSATEVCLRQATIDGTELTVPYTCSSGAKFACCSTDTGSTMDEPGHGLGTCTKMPPMPNGLPPEDKEEVDSRFDKEEERHPLGCMCLNSRMTPQRGQCCGKCDEGMCPKSDERCQGCSEENDTCVPNASLGPRSRRFRRFSGLTPSGICKAQSERDGTDFTEPYKCTGRAGDGYACCESGLGDTTTPRDGLGLGTCTKMPSDEEDDSDNNNRSPSSGGQCTPDGSLNPRSRAQRGISATSICEEKSAETRSGFTVPYSCSGHGGPTKGGYACCTPDSDDEVTDPGHGLGTCTKLPKMSNGLPPLDEKKEVVYDEEEGRHPLGCMCMNSRMMPQRGQCCGKCDDGMCPESDVRCQGCDAAESGDTEEGACEVDPSLSPFSRKYSMRSPSQVCEEESSATGSNFTVPYKCRTGHGQRRGGLQYACCETGLGDEMTSLGGKKCTKEEEGEEEEVLVAYK